MGKDLFKVNNKNTRATYLTLKDVALVSSLTLNRYLFALKIMNSLCKKLNFLGFSWIMLKNSQTSEHHNIFKVCLAIFQHYA